jgi:hypothetical protein
MTDDLDELYRSYYEQGTTDGLPVVPPTDERVEEMLRGTDLSPDTEITRLGDREGILTVEKLAINGVMAGCLPIHMPVLIAGVRVQSEPASSITEAAVGTGSSGHLYLINGPIREQLDINSGTGALGPGFRSNATIGRALWLALQNTAQLHPSEQAMGVIGCPFKNMVAGENEEKSPWEPFHVGRGYEPSDSTISLTNANCFIQTSARGPNKDEQEVLSKLIYNTPPEIRFRPNAMYALSPTNAYELRELTKREAKEYIYENTVVGSHEFYEANPSSYGTDSALDESVNENEFGSDEVVADINPRLYRDPNQVKIFVTGGEGAWNAVIGPLEGGPVTEEIEFPEDWDDLLSKYRPYLDREWGAGWLR